MRLIKVLTLAVGKLHAGDREEDLPHGDDGVLGQEPHDVDLIVLHDHVGCHREVVIVTGEEDVVAGADFEGVGGGDEPGIGRLTADHGDIVSTDRRVITG